MPSTLCAGPQMQRDRGGGGGERWRGLHTSNLLSIWVALLVLSSCVTETGSVTIWLETFQGEDRQGLGAGTFPVSFDTAWSVETSRDISTSTTARFGVFKYNGDNVFIGTGLQGVGHWYSDPIWIACRTSIKVLFDYTSDAAGTPLDWMSASYKVDNGSWVEAFVLEGPVDRPNNWYLAQIGQIGSGDTLTIRISMGIGGAQGEYRFDNVVVDAVYPPPKTRTWSSYTFSDWSEWGAYAPAVCGVAQNRTRTMTATRECLPTNCPNDLPCVGASNYTIVETQNRTADDNCCVTNGEWSDWQISAAEQWSQWSPTRCGVRQTRSQILRFARTCTEPAPRCNGAPCEGPSAFSSTSSQTRTEIENCCVVDGSWSAWSGQWGEWSPFLPINCGVDQIRSRIQNRTRSCSEPATSCGGKPCAGSSFILDVETDNRTAAVNCCPVTGNWSPWSFLPWSPWGSFEPARCGVTQVRTRFRFKTHNCTNPTPACGGAPCLGEDTMLDVNETDTRSVLDNCCVIDGNWTDWVSGAWSEWSAFSPPTCGVDQTRARSRNLTRTCSNPAPSCGGKACSGSWQMTENSTEVRTASSNCCPVNGQWSPWAVLDTGPWSSFLPLECGVDQRRNRTVTSTRTCTSPAPSCEGTPCLGNATQTTVEVDTRASAVNCCPVAGNWSAWAFDAWSAWGPYSSDNCSEPQTRERFRSRTRLCSNPAPSCGGAACEGASIFTERDEDTRIFSRVDGGWTNFSWGSWSPWSASPIQGCNATLYRERTRIGNRSCTDPAPFCGGSFCEGSATSLERENSTLFLESSEWSPWNPAPWSEWTAFDPSNCGVPQQRSRQRTSSRTCLSLPSCPNITLSCPGLRSQIETQIENRTAADNCCPVNGNWTAWSFGSWSQWAVVSDKVCAQPYVVSRQRDASRNCTNPAPACRGLPCVGDAISRQVVNETRNDTVLCCPVDGGWSPVTWSAWTAWTFSERDCNRPQTRNRTRSGTRACNLPEPFCGGANCTGEALLSDRESKVETLSSAYWTNWRISRDWSEWGDYTPTTCGVSQTRTRIRFLERTCIFPDPLCPNSNCTGDARKNETESDTRPAASNCCTNLQGIWTDWSFTFTDWTEFTPRVCGFDQVRTRLRVSKRTCTRPFPICADAVCPGDDTAVETITETRSKDQNCCLVNGQWSAWVSDPAEEWSAWTPRSCGVPQSRSRRQSATRTCTSPSPSCGGRTCDGSSARSLIENDNRTIGNNCCPGTYQIDPKQDFCVAVTECVIGEFVLAVATPTSDTICSKCPKGSVGNGVDCFRCPAGFYVDAGRGGKCADYVCPANTFDHDQNPATPCVACSGSCPPGTSETKSCLPTADRECTSCPDGSFSPDGNVCRRCSPACPNGTFALMHCSSKISNNVCRSCTPESSCRIGVAQVCTEHGDTVCQTAPYSNGGASSSDNSGTGMNIWVYIAIGLGVLFLVMNAFWCGRNWKKSSVSLQPSAVEMQVVGTQMPMEGGHAVHHPAFRETNMSHNYADTPSVFGRNKPRRMTMWVGHEGEDPKKKSQVFERNPSVGKPMQIHRPPRITLPPSMAMMDAHAMRENGKYGSPNGLGRDTRVVRDGDEFYEIEDEESINIPHIDPNDNAEDSYLTFLPDPAPPSPGPQSIVDPSSSPQRQMLQTPKRESPSGLRSSPLGGARHARQSSLDARINNAIYAGPTPPVPRRKVQLNVPSTPTSVISSGSDELNPQIAIREDQQPTEAMQAVVRRSQYLVPPRGDDPIYSLSNHQTDEPIYASSNSLERSANLPLKSSGLQVPNFPVARQGKHAYAEIQETKSQMSRSPAHSPQAAAHQSGPEKDLSSSRDTVLDLSNVDSSPQQQGKNERQEVEQQLQQQQQQQQQHEKHEKQEQKQSPGSKTEGDRSRGKTRRHPSRGPGGSKVRRARSIDNHLYEVPDDLRGPNVAGAGATSSSSSSSPTKFLDVPAGTPHRQSRNKGDGEMDSGKHTASSGASSLQRPGERANADEIESEGSEEMRRIWAGESDESDVEGGFYSLFGGQGKEGPMTSSLAAKEATIRAPDQGWAADFIAKYMPPSDTTDWRHDARARHILEKVSAPKEDAAEAN